MRKLARLFAKAKLYILVAPTCLFLLGAAMNQAVLIVNGDKFPVMLNNKGISSYHDFDPATGMIDDIHCIMTSTTRLNWLADYIDLRDAHYSPGDLLLELSYALAIYSSVVWATLMIAEVNKEV